MNFFNPALWRAIRSRKEIMDKYEMALKIMACFPESFINSRGQFIAHKKTNTYLVFDKCETLQDLAVAVIEWFSRDAYKTAPYRSGAANEKFHHFMLEGINKFLGTAFTTADMELIYTYLGNGVKHSLAVEFVESGCNMELLRSLEH